MERDITRALQRAERSSKLSPKVDSSKIGSEGEKAGRTFASRFQSASSSGGQSAGSGMGKAVTLGIAGVLTATAGAAAVGAFVRGMQEAFTTGIDFDKVANTFQGVTASTVAQTNEMRAAARALGSDSSLAGATASDAGKAMLELAKGGLTAQQAMEAARGTIQLATAGQLDAAEAAKIQSGAMNTFQLSAGDATRVADLLAAAANASAADVSDLGQALTQGGSVAAGFGVSIEDTLTALTMFSRFGINGSDAGTMLKTSLQSITDQGKPAQGAIEQLGLTLYDAQGQFVGLESMLKQVAAASKTMSQEQFQAATNVLFGSDAMRASMVAANGGADAWDNASQAVNRQGAAADMAKANMTGLPGVMEGIGNAAEGLKLGVYDSFNAMAQAAGGQFLTNLEDISNWMSTHKADMIGFFATIGEAVVNTTGVLMAFGAGSARAMAVFINALGDTLGAAQKMVAGVNRLLGRTEIADQIDRDAEASFGWADGLYTVADALDGGVGMARNFAGSVDEIAAKAQESARFTDALGGSVASIKGADIVLKDNTPEAIANIDKTKYAIETMPDGQIKIVPLTQDALNEMNAWRRSQGEQPVDLSVKPNLTQANADMQAFVTNWKNAMTGIAPPPATPGGGPTNPLLAPIQPPRAAGGLFGKLPTNAMIQPATEGLVQWAEPSTGGEAFIPLNGGERSKAIWAQTGKLIGAFEQGAIRGSKGGLQPNASQLFDILSQAFPQLQEIGGYRSNGNGSNDHPSGQALDIMIPGWDTPEGKALGDQINSFLQSNAPSLGLESTIWQDFRKPVGGDGHKLGRKGANEGHYNHIHAKVGGGPATGAALTAMSAAGDETYTGQTDPYTGQTDPQKLLELQQDIVDADAKVAIQKQQIAEMDADASESSKMQQNDELRRAERDAADARQELTTYQQTGEKGSSKSSKSSSGGDSGFSSLGSGLVSGALEALGLPGFSNILEWPNVKSALGLLNFGGSLLGGMMGVGSEEGGGTDLLTGTGGGALAGVGLDSLSGFLKPIGAGAVTPIQQPNGPHVGTGAAPGPAVVVNGNVGMDPKAFTDRVGAANNASWRKNMAAVKP